MGSDGALAFFTGKITDWDLPGGPVIKTSSSNAGSADSMPLRGLRPHMPRGQKTKTKQNTQKHYCDKVNKLLKNHPLQKNKI